MKRVNIRDVGGYYSRFLTMYRCSSSVFCFGNFNPKFTARRKLIVVKRFLCFLYYDRKSLYSDIRKRKDGA